MKNQKTGRYEVEIIAGGGGAYKNLISRQCEVLNLKDETKKDVEKLVGMAGEKGLTRYKRVDEIITASIYIACRQEGVPLTLHKICSSLMLDYKTINKVYRYLVKRMHLQISPTMPSTYIQRFAKELKLQNSTVEKAKGILDEIKGEYNISGKGPAGVAAASLCLASEMQKEPMSQKDMALVSGVTQVTIRNRYREMEEIVAPNNAS